MRTVAQNTHRPKKSIFGQMNQTTDSRSCFLYKDVCRRLSLVRVTTRPALPNLRIQLFNSSCLRNKTQNLQLGIFGHSKVVYHSVYQLYKNFWEVLRLRLSTSPYSVGMWTLTSIQHALSTQFTKPCTYVYGIRMQTSVNGEYTAHACAYCNKSWFKIL